MNITCHNCKSVISTADPAFKLQDKLTASKQREEELEVKYNACHAELVQIMRILHCIAEAPAPSMEQTVVVRGVCELAYRVKKADDRVRVLTGYIDKAIYADSQNERQAILEEALELSPQQTAEQIERWHVEWMKTLPVAGWYCDTGTSKCIAMNHQDDGIPLVAIPPLPKEQP